MKRASRDLAYLCIVALIVSVVVGFLALLPAYMEARTFNKFRGGQYPQATIIDAIFGSLRVEACG